MLVKITNRTCSSIRFNLDIHQYLQTILEYFGKDTTKAKVKRKISEAPLIRKHRPSLNIHENAVPLELFNCLCTISC